MDDALLVTCLQITSLLLALFLCYPQLLVVLKRSQIRGGFQGGPEEAARYWLHSIDEEHFQQLAGLGFTPVGVYWETADFKRTFRQFVFTKPAERCFAMLYPRDQIMPRRASFLTVFSDGAVVFTKNYQGGVQAKEPDFHSGGLPPPRMPVDDEQAEKEQTQSSINWGRWSWLVSGGLSLGIAGTIYKAVEDPMPWWGLLMIAGLAFVFTHLSGQRAAKGPGAKPDIDYRVPLAAVLAEHRRRVAEFVGAGRTPLLVNGEDDFLETHRRYHDHPHLRRIYRSAELCNLCGKIVALAFIPAILGFSLGVNHVAVWAVLLAECLVMAAFRYGCSTAFVIQFLRKATGEQPHPPS